MQKLSELFIEQNVALLFDVKLDLNTESVLFRLNNILNKNNIVNLFEITASTIKNYVNFDFFY